MLGASAVALLAGRNSEERYRAWSAGVSYAFWVARNVTRPEPEAAASPYARIRAA